MVLIIVLQSKKSPAARSLRESSRAIKECRDLVLFVSARGSGLGGAQSTSDQARWAGPMTPDAGLRRRVPTTSH